MIPPAGGGLVDNPMEEEEDVGAQPPPPADAEADAANAGPGLQLLRDDGLSIWVDSFREAFHSRPWNQTRGARSANSRCTEGGRRRRRAGTIR
jgi:hypothetical protein